LPPVESFVSVITWQEQVKQCARQFAPYNVTATSFHCKVGFKLRCGGATARAVPSSAEVAAAICVCRDAGIFWKPTAGLHHPFRRVDPKLAVPMHGFLNLQTAAVLADVHRLDAERVQ